ncbi:MAG: glycosyltransferase [Minwuia sp.]|uniref:glycosyltransferase n=1 Tax=Minwuia sp. TaxID=2493630 RepID=UPI003A8950E3
MKRVVAFVCINGSGMGHATRILAIARRLPEGITPLIVSNSPALDAFDLLPGAVIEHIPGFDYLDMSRRAWTSQLRREFDALLRFYGATVVVQDGTALYPWLLDGVLGNDLGRRLAWIRRPMWRDVEAVYKNLENQKFCDLVIEPGEAAAEIDDGPTTRAMELAPPPARFVRTAPIRLLDDSEILDRPAARVRLGIGNGEKAVLIQLGAGAIERNWDAAGGAIAALRRRGGVRIFLARWKIAGDLPMFGEDVTVLDAYPLARLFPAFDMVVSAAGYNSYHELAAARVPAIFVPNRMEVDDQARRAGHAATQGWAEVELRSPAGTFAGRIEAAVNRVLERPSRLLDPGVAVNGARQAAEAIAALCPA